MKRHPRILVGLVLICASSLTFDPLATFGAEKKGPPEEHAHDHEDEHGHEDEKEEKDEHAHPAKKGDEHAHGAEKEDEHGHAEEEGEDEHGHGDGHEEEGSSRIGPDKAITAASKKDGIQLAEKAVKRLALASVEAKGPAPRVPSKSLVFYQGETGVYRLRNGWYKLVDVKVTERGATDSVVRSSELQGGDRIVSEGVPLLRVAEMEAWGGSGDGHGH